MITKKPIPKSKRNQALKSEKAIHADEEYYDDYDWQFESEEEDYDEDRPAVNNNALDLDEDVPDDVRSEEHFHRLKNSHTKKHAGTDEQKQDDVVFHSKAGKDSKLTGSNVRRKKSQF